MSWIDAVKNLRAIKKNKSTDKEIYSITNLTNIMNDLLGKSIYYIDSIEWYDIFLDSFPNKLRTDELISSDTDSTDLSIGNDSNSCEKLIEIQQEWEEKIRELLTGAIEKYRHSCDEMTNTLIICDKITNTLVNFLKQVPHIAIKCIALKHHICDCLFALRIHAIIIDYQSSKWLATWMPEDCRCGAGKAEHNWTTIPTEIINVTSVNYWAGTTEGLTQLF